MASEIAHQKYITFRHFAEARKVAGSIPDEDIAFFFQFTKSFQQH